MFSLVQSVDCRTDYGLIIKVLSEPPRAQVAKAAALAMAMSAAKYLPSAIFLTLNFGQCKKLELNVGNISDI